MKSPLILLALILLLPSLSISTTPDYDSNTSYKRSSLTGIVEPFGLCLEYGSDGYTSVFWSYHNSGPQTTIAVGSSNQFIVNGQALLTNFPPTIFKTGDIKNSAIVRVNLPPAGLFFSWTLEDSTVHLNGSNGVNICPSTMASVVLGATSPSAPHSVSSSALVAYLAPLLGINATRFSVSLTETMPIGPDFMLDIAIAVDPSAQSPLLATNHLAWLLNNDPSTIANVSTLIAATIVSVKVSTSGIDEVSPSAPSAPKPHEISLGTILGIIFNCVLGLTILIVATTTVLFRLTAQREASRMLKMSEKLALPPQPLFSGSASTLPPFTPT